MRILGFVLSSVLVSQAAFANVTEANLSADDSIFGDLTASVCLHNDVADHELKLSYNYGGDRWQEITIVPHQTVIVWTKFPEGSYPNELQLKWNSSLEGITETLSQVKPYIARRIKHNCQNSHKMKFVAGDGIAEGLQLVEMD